MWLCELDSIAAAANGRFGTQQPGVASTNEKQLWAAREGKPTALYFNGFGDGQRILEFNAQVPDRTVHLGVAEKELNGSEIFGLLADLSDLGSSHCMGSVGGCLKVD